MWNVGGIEPTHPKRGDESRSIRRWNSPELTHKVQAVSYRKRREVINDGFDPEIELFGHLVNKC